MLNQVRISKKIRNIFLKLIELYLYNLSDILYLHKYTYIFIAGQILLYV